MQTVTVDLINDDAMKLLHDLELLQIIRVHKNDEASIKSSINPIAKYKGKMTKQPAEEVERQLRELRDSWE